jgi:drug/metabolite transporter (DMT)-like permease
MFLVKHQSSSETPEKMTLYFLGVGAILSLGIAVFDWQWPTLSQLYQLAAIGVLTFFGQLWLIRGYSLGLLSIVAPIEFCRLPIAVMLGIAIFSDQITIMTALGMLTVVFSSLFILRAQQGQ